MGSVSLQLLTAYDEVQNERNELKKYLFPWQAESKEIEKRQNLLRWEITFSQSQCLQPSIYSQGTKWP